MVNHPTCRTLFPYTTLFRSDQRAIHRFLTTEPAELRVDDLAVSEVDPHLSPASVDPQDAALPADLEGLEEIHDAHVLQGPAEACSAAGRRVRGEAIVGAPGEQEVHPRDELAHEDGL